MNTKLQDAPVCPHCGHAETDAWEWNFGDGLEGEHEGDCNNCGEPFTTRREIAVYYSTRAAAALAPQAGAAKGEA